VWFFIRRIAGIFLRKKSAFFLRLADFFFFRSGKNLLPFAQVLFVFGRCRYTERIEAAISFQCGNFRHPLTIGRFADKAGKGIVLVNIVGQQQVLAQCFSTNGF
jgi:hypothetical protein